MDLNSIAEFAKSYLLGHWPFFMMSLNFGMLGVFTKRFIWTKEKASKSKFSYWMRATMSFHPIFGGALFGALGHLLSGGNMVVGEGIEQSGSAVMVYYAGSGLFSGWAYSALKHFAKSRGIEPEKLDMPSRYPEVVRQMTSKPPNPAPGKGE